MNILRRIEDSIKKTYYLCKNSDINKYNSLVEPRWNEINKLLEMQHKIINDRIGNEIEKNANKISVHLFNIILIKFIIIKKVMCIKIHLEHIMIELHYLYTMNAIPFYLR